MRFIVIEQASDLQALSARLLRNPAGGQAGSQELSQATLEQIRMLNPHADFQHLEAGTVLLLPEAPELKDADSQSLAGNSFEDFTTRTREGLQAVAQRMKSSAEALAADRAAVTATVKSAAVKRLIESDPLLKKQLDEAGSESSDAQKQAQEASRQLETFQKGLDVELQILRIMLE
ncbi:hypothetical protein [Polaromonas sp.]|uniref:hypothetical protein n=1 Tax=Polaromonas sp. TaxID=1869339 RepID=UPI0013B67984|nr:hypothetical protein [Polaromonas sp.]NDP63648.1 hypothetical protein [Polaromonas sp.]